VTKRSIALVIRDVSGGPPVAGCGPPEPWLLVRRPDDDEDLPGVWGLPAGTLGPGESPETLVRRIGLEKLGVELDPGAAVASGSAERARYLLVMDLWTAAIVAGTPDVSATETTADSTRYSEWKWDDPSALEDGARQGSLCCKLGVALAVV
jgi:ADP-ribose pyrophosphatase YjhB (NUDIX family)